MKVRLARRDNSVCQSQRALLPELAAQVNVPDWVAIVVLNTKTCDAVHAAVGQIKDDVPVFNRRQNVYSRPLAATRKTKRNQRCDHNCQFTHWYSPPHGFSRSRLNPYLLTMLTRRPLTPHVRHKSSDERHAQVGLKKENSSEKGDRELPTPFIPCSLFRPAQ
jgi:hypothetical protein